MTTPSPPPSTASVDELPICGKSKTSKSVLGFALVELVITPATKSPSKTIAAFGGDVNTWVTDVGKSVCSACEVPPGMLLVSPMTCAIVVSACFTDGSVHGIWCCVSWSYLSGPAWRR
jgi:hypothetical protein